MVIELIMQWKRNKMTRKTFTERKNYWEPSDKAMAIMMYDKYQCKIPKIATRFQCSIEKVETLLKNQGYL